MTIRSNALTLHGTPITHLPTARIFAYAGHFDAQPVALEWVSDDTCGTFLELFSRLAPANAEALTTVIVLVFESRTHARAALRALQKTGSEEMPDEDGFVTGQPVPVALWPAEERIAQSLGAGDGLRGAVLVRRALQTDVKARGAAKVSEFYAKHGANAGKEVTEPRRAEVDIDEADDGAPRKRRRGGRRRRGQANDDDAPREALEDMGTSSPPALAGRLRSDNIGNDGRSLLQRTSVLRSHDRDDDEDMATDDSVRDSSRRGDRREGGGEGEGRRRRGGRNRRGGGGEGNGERTKTAERPKKTQAELDAELDAFFNNRG